MSRSTLKYTYAGWLRHFYEEFPTKESLFMPGPPVLQPLRRAAFLTFWLSRYVFIGPRADSISPDVCILASLLAEGKRLPLAPLYLGSLYAHLD